MKTHYKITITNPVVDEQSMKKPERFVRYSEWDSISAILRQVRAVDYAISLRAESGRMHALRPNDINDYEVLVELVAK